MANPILTMAFLASHKASQDAQQTATLQLANSSIEAIQIFAKTHTTAMAAIAGSIAIYKTVALGSLATTVISFFAVVSPNRSNNDGLLMFICLASAITCLISACIWWDKSSAYQYHANWNSRCLEMINIKGNQG